VNAHRHKPSLALADHASVIDDESVPWLPMSPQVEGVSIKYFRLDPPRGSRWRCCAPWRARACRGSATPAR
jgi:hypothetical protein